MSNPEEEKKTETEEDTAYASANTEESQEWLKILGAVPADRCYEDSPEIASIEAALSTDGHTTVETTKEAGLEDNLKQWACIYLTREMLLESTDYMADIFCPAKVVLEGAKIAFQDTLTENQKKMRVWANYLPCHLCPKYYKLGRERLKKYRLRTDQIGFLEEFDLYEERPISNPKYLEGTNSNRRKSAKSLEKQKFIRTAYRYLQNPANPGKAEPTLIANLSPAGYVASGKDPGFVEKNLPKVQLQKPMHVVAVYVEKLRAEIEHLREFVKTKKQQRTPLGQYITLGIIELERQHDFILKYDALGISPWRRSERIQPGP